MSERRESYWSFCEGCGRVFKTYGRRFCLRARGPVDCSALDFKAYRDGTRYGAVPVNEALADRVRSNPKRKAHLVPVDATRRRKKKGPTKDRDWCIPMLYRTPEELAEHWRNVFRRDARKRWRQQQNAYANEMYSLDALGRDGVDPQGPNAIDRLLDNMEPEPRRPCVRVAPDAEVDVGVFMENPDALLDLEEVCQQAHRFGGEPAWFLVEHLGLSLHDAKKVLVAADNAWRRVTTVVTDVQGRDSVMPESHGGTNHGRGSGRKHTAPKGTRTGRKPRQKYRTKAVSV